MNICERIEKYSKIKETKKIKLCNSKDAYNYILSEFQNLLSEVVFCVFVNMKNQVISKELISTGSLNYATIEPRDIIKRVLNLNAGGFFMFHNHPSGDVTPSEDDIQITIKLKKICKELNIRLLDHIIIGDEFFSMFDNDLF